MLGRILAGATLAGAAFAATGAVAEISKVGEAAGWEVAVNDQMGPGCLIEKKDQDFQVQLGVDARQAQKTGYMAVFTRANIGEQEGQAAAVQFEVGGRTFNGTAFGEQREGFQGAWVPVDNPEFVYDLAKMETMKITVAGLDPIEVSLKGTDDAFKALRECQNAQ